jgi:hypothetical protein
MIKLVSSSIESVSAVPEIFILHVTLLEN